MRETQSLSTDTTAAAALAKIIDKNTCFPHVIIAIFDVLIRPGSAASLLLSSLCCPVNLMMCG